MSAEKRRRIHTAVFTFAGLLCTGLVYAFLLIPCGLWISCPFYTLTHLRCPGCGVTRMCLALLHGDIRAAFCYNAGLFLAAPFILLAIGLELFRYIEQPGKESRCRKLEQVLTTALLVFLLGWFVIRNLLGI